MAHLRTTGTRPVEIARRLDVSRQAVHQTLRELQEMGLVQLVPDPDDGRGQLVTLTNEGHANVRDAKVVFARLEKELARRIGRGFVHDLRMALEADWGPPRT
jgi:DNA-binding MarR family transcriptional regulator